jgi:T5SS/PEP-CTERM-associated repeat protein/autotransporter-associated beta strand protein
VTGVGSTWNNWGDLYVGRSGTGILNIEAGGQVFSNSDFSILGYDSGDSGTAIVTGNGSKWSISSMEFSVGLWGSGTLKIEDGGQLDTNNLSEIGTLSGSIGTVTVTGAGSKWTNSSALYVGLSGTGILNIEAGGQVFGNGFIGFNSSSCGTITVTGNGSKLISGSPVGYSGIGTLNIEAGGFVTGVNCLGYNSGSSGYVTVTGIGSKCSAVGTFYVGLSGAGILNIGNGIASEGTLNAKSFTLANSSSAIATCNLNGGTLQTSSIAKGSGTASFNWSDGTIRNYNASTDLTVSGTNNLTLKLAATGTHSFNIDAGRKGTVAAVLCDATSGGTLAKQGDGLLVLSAVNTYTGTTTIESGQLKLVAGGDIAFSSEIINRAGFMIDGGDHSVKKITGSGAIQVLSGSLTAGSIVQDTLTIGGTTNAVPEPASLVLLAIFGFAAAGMAWRRRER